MNGIDPGLIETIHRWIARFDPSGPPPILGIAGSQGSGKSTLARAVAERFGGASLALADRVHPLFATRGPPGTHDLTLLNRVLDRLGAAGPNDRIALPRFDKLADDRADPIDWPWAVGRPRLIVLEGWALGATPQADADLVAPINALERDRDPEGLWRRTVNAALIRDYVPLRERLDALIFLKAPGFEVVLDWRCEQEAGLMGADKVPPKRRTALADFVQHYERLTRHMLAGGIDADLTVVLEADRRIVAIQRAGGSPPAPGAF